VKNGHSLGAFKDKKALSFRGEDPLITDQGLCPWTPLGAPLPDP